jgi:hypothetical protein
VQGDDAADRNWGCGSTQGEDRSTWRYLYVLRRTRWLEVNEEFEARELENWDEWWYQGCEGMVLWVPVVDQGRRYVHHYIKCVIKAPEKMSFNINLVGFRPFLSSHLLFAGVQV